MLLLKGKFKAAGLDLSLLLRAQLGGAAVNS